MELYVVRHAVAHKRDEDLWPDAKRPLTPEGEERFPVSLRKYCGSLPNRSDDDCLL